MEMTDNVNKIEPVTANTKTCSGQDVTLTDVVRIETTQDFDYVYLQDHGVDIAGQTDIQFTLKAGNDGHVALSKTDGHWKTDSYEIVIGGWNNQKSVIRKCDQCKEKIGFNHRPLNASEFRPFWISWADGLIQVGSGNTLFENEFMSWPDPEPHQVNYIGISTGWDANGTWVFGFIDGGWSEWGTWSSCNKTCGGGWRFRLRHCDNPPPAYGIDCVGVSAHEEMCETHKCPIDGGWAAWGAWTACSVTCGQGKRHRGRFCRDPPPQFEGEDCPGHDEEEVTCMDRDCPVHGGWSEWTEWEPCSQSCDEGTEARWRNCSNPSPMFGGEDCAGVGHDVRLCFLRGCPENGSWSWWGEWRSCSQTCGRGSQHRTRTCTSPPPINGGLPCPGKDILHRDCQLNDCPVDGSWSSWTTWSACSTTCSEGQRMRERSCDDPVPAHSGLPCAGKDVEYDRCNDRECPVDGQWSTWSLWSTCSLTCGLGSRFRNRACDSPTPQFDGQPCPGRSIQEDPCELKQCPVDGIWGTWGHWSQCSVTCAEGMRYRERSCDNPTPAYEGNECEGDGEALDSCQMGACPVDGGWSEWSAWGTCSVTCGHGKQERARACDNPQPINDGKNCSGPEQEQQDCQVDQCPVDGLWSAWNSWSQCSRTCESGSRFRTRLCNNPLPANGGLYCAGEEKEIANCSLQPCPIDGQWSSWGEWSTCSADCGEGISTRLRLCDNPGPAHNGAECSGDDSQEDTCKIKECPVEGGWSTWTMWSECSLSCDQGLTNRRRFCDNPRPAFGGSQCQGNDIETVTCLVTDCPVNGGWSVWGNWSDCSRTCDEGYTTRYRYCSDPLPAYGGTNCTGAPVETMHCFLRTCSVDGSWSKWTDWSSCSVTCGRGQMSRVRNCSDPAPRENGKWCEGRDSEDQYCKDAYCPIDGGWTNWVLWTTCSKTCGGGHRARTRFCGFPQPEHGGANCSGDPVHNVSCNLADCPLSEEDQPPEEEPVEAPGAVGIGIIGLAMMCALLGAVIILDLTTIHRHFAFMKRNVKHFWKNTLKKGGGTSRRYKDRDGIDSENNLEATFQNNAYTPSPNSYTYYDSGKRANRRLPRHNIDGDEHFMNIENNLNTDDPKNFDVNYSSKGMDKYSDIELRSTRL